MKKIMSTAAACLLALLLLCSCSGGTDLTVSVQAVSMIIGSGSVGLYDRYAGVVEAGETFSVEKDPDMQIKERLVNAGDEVKAGDILFSYDTEAVSLELEKKKIELEQLNAEITTKSAQIEQLEKEKSRVSASAQLDYTLQIQELQVDVAEGKLNVTAKEKEIERYTLLMDNAQVTSPVDGRVQKVNETGATDDYGNPLPYMSVAQSGAFRVKGSINEQSAGSLTEGTSVIIRSRTDETATWTGSIERIDWDNPIQGNSGIYYDGADELTSASKYPFHVVLDSDDGLMLGQHVYIEPNVGAQPEGMMLPACYLADADTNPYVWAANSHDKLEKRNVTLGVYDEQQDAWEITDGLTDEDYIAFPDETCVQGAKVIRYDESSFDNGNPNEGISYEDGAIEGAMPIIGEGDADNFGEDGVAYEDTEEAGAVG